MYAVVLPQMLEGTHGVYIDYRVVQIKVSPTELSANRIKTCQRS